MDESILSYRKRRAQRLKKRGFRLDYEKESSAYNWITMENGEHVPIDENGNSAGGPTKGRSFRYSTSTKKGQSKSWSNNPKSREQFKKERLERKSAEPKKLTAEEIKSSLKEKKERLTAISLPKRDPSFDYDWQLHNKKHALERAEERKNEINGRTAESLEKELEECKAYEKKFDEINEKFYDRPKRGTPEREEWDKWYESIGGTDGFNAMFTEYTKNSERKASVRNALISIDTYGEDGGYEKASKELRELEDKISKVKQEYETKKAEYQKVKSDYEETVRQAYPTFDSCKDKDEVMEKLYGSGYFDTDTIAYPGQLDGLDYEHSKACAKTVEAIFAKYPKLAGKVGKISSTRLDGNVYAHSGQYVEVNNKWYSDTEKLKKSYEQDVANKYHPVGTNSDSVLWHEYGHQVDELLSISFTSELGRTIGGRRKQFSAVLFEKVRKQLGMKASECKRSVSIYAEHNKSGGAREFMAEAFAEYCCSPNPRPTAKLAGEIIESYINRLEEKKS